MASRSKVTWDKAREYESSVERLSLNHSVVLVLTSWQKAKMSIEVTEDELLSGVEDTIDVLKQKASKNSELMTLLKKINNNMHTMG